MAIHLVPLHVFKAEITRLNELYWTSKYSYSRVSELLNSLNKSKENPKVNHLLPSDDAGETTHIIRPLSEFLVQLKNNESDLRTTAILHMCSAFETALSNYFALCAIYMPHCVDKKYKGKYIPDIFQEPDNYEKLKEWSVKIAGARLHGVYTKRLDTFTDIFGCASLPSDLTKNLNDHYQRRHLIAHDQSLVAADAPDLGVMEILQGQISIDEDVWKTIIHDFQAVIEGLDETIQKNVVTDNGLPIAIYHIVTQSGSINIGELRNKIAVEWKIGKINTETSKSSIMSLKKISEQMGFITQAVSAKYEICANADKLTNPSIEILEAWQSSPVYLEIDWYGPKEARHQIGFWFLTKFRSPDDLNFYLNSGYLFFKNRYNLNEILIAAKIYNEKTAEWIVGGETKKIVPYIRHFKQLNIEGKFEKFSYKRLGHSLY